MKIKLDGGAKIPQYATEGSAGFDLAAIIPECIEVGKTELIHTGISVEVPEGYELQIRSRSGLAKSGLVVANSPGTIDSDYRGEIGVLLHNQSPYATLIAIGDRIAQAVLSPVVQAKFEIVGSLSETERGSGGFGSTGSTGD